MENASTHRSRKAPWGRAGQLLLTGVMACAVASAPAARAKLFKHHPHVSLKHHPHGVLKHHPHGVTKHHPHGVTKHHPHGVVKHHPHGVL